MFWFKSFWFSDLKEVIELFCFTVYDKSISNYELNDWKKLPCVIEHSTILIYADWLAYRPWQIVDDP